MRTIAICSSANFYRQVVDLQNKLEELGYEIIIPASAEKMKKSGNYDVSGLKTWFNDDKDYHKKAKLMQDHFREIEAADSILVLNNKKNNIPNYIGGNVLMEMAVAFYLNKTIFIFNEMPKESLFLEEIRGVEPHVLHGKIDNLRNL